MDQELVCEGVFPFEKLLRTCISEGPLVKEEEEERGGGGFG